MPKKCLDAALYMKLYDTILYDIIYTICSYFEIHFRMLRYVEKPLQREINYWDINISNLLQQCFFSQNQHCKIKIVLKNAINCASTKIDIW